jgi:phage portal protein BeeE
VGLLDRVASARGRQERRYSADSWLTDYLMPAYDSGFGPGAGLVQTLTGNKSSEIQATLPAYAAALRRSPPAFAAEIVRSNVISQARFVFRNTSASSTPRRTFGSRELGVLERPWPNATTGQMLARMEWHAGLAGNAYVTRRAGGRLRVLRPDWTAILFGSHSEPDYATGAVDGEIIGYLYQNGGIHGPNKPVTIMPEDMAHWSPMPDPENAEIGMSWITPAIRDIQADRASTEHKLRFFENGATPNMVVKGIPAVTKTVFDDYVDMLEERHTGIRNAYRTLYLAGGADATVVGADLKSIDFSATQGAGETRIAALSRVPAPILGFSEGLGGSSLNAGNLAVSRRNFADIWLYPMLQDVCAALAPLLNVPSDAELWFDVADVPLLREDAKDAAAIEQTKASTIGGLVKDGFTPESAIAAVMAQDMTLLVPIPGWISVQLQQMVSAAPALPAGQPKVTATPAVPAKPAPPKRPAIGA